MSTDAGAAPLRNSELEAALARDLDEVASYRAYAAWLTERGDPQGALIEAALAGEARKSTVAAYAEASRRVGPEEHFKPEWQRGFIRKAVCLSEHEAMGPESVRSYPSSDDLP